MAVNDLSQRVLPIQPFVDRDAFPEAANVLDVPG
jgi:hypothetical protein